MLVLDHFYLKHNTINFQSDDIHLAIGVFFLNVNIKLKVHQLHNYTSFLHEEPHYMCIYLCIVIHMITITSLVMRVIDDTKGHCIYTKESCV